MSKRFAQTSQQITLVIPRKLVELIDEAWIQQRDRSRTAWIIDACVGVLPPALHAEWQAHVDAQWEEKQPVK